MPTPSSQKYMLPSVDKLTNLADDDAVFHSDFVVCFHLGNVHIPNICRDFWIEIHFVVIANEIPSSLYVFESLSYYYSVAVVPIRRFFK